MGDRVRLPPPCEMETASGWIVADSPETQTLEEVMVRDAFGVALGLAAEAISVESNFFELGGNSIRAMVLTKQLTGLLGRSINIADVLRLPTIATLAALLASGEVEDAAALQ